MRIALLADIHGNSLALEAVLEDIRSSGGAEAFWVLGDLAAIGPDPLGVLERLSALPNTRFIRGNTDRYLLRGQMPWPLLANVQADPSLLVQHLQVARSFAWTTGAVGATGWLPWMDELPLEFTESLPDGTRVLAVHSEPGTDDGLGLHIYMDESNLEDHLEQADAELILVGHTHVPFDRQVGKKRLVNPGSLSNPFPPDLRAAYAFIHAEPDGYQVELRRVDYDREAVIKTAYQVNHPAAEYISQHLRGVVTKDWSKLKPSG